tara:strand:- start:158 stop:535 length:378 start_codon:yes stop_codon:yes gene_type:complete
MLRISLLELSLFLLPFALFAMWRLGMSLSAEDTGEVRPAPNLILAAIGTLLAAIGFVVIVLMGGAEGSGDDRRYVPPRLEGDRIRQGEFSDEVTTRQPPNAQERPFGQPSEHSDGRGNDDETQPE